MHVFPSQARGPDDGTCSLPRLSPCVVTPPPTNPLTPFHGPVRVDADAKAAASRTGSLLLPAESAPLPSSTEPETEDAAAGRPEEAEEAEEEAEGGLSTSKLSIVTAAPPGPAEGT